MINRRAIGGVFAAALALAAPAALAQDSLLDSVGKAAGWISPPADPPDFVKASRPREPAEEIPVFSAPQEPRSRVKSADELKTMGADLERASRGGGAPSKSKPRHKK